MTDSRQRLILGATTVVVLVLLLWSCAAAGSDDSGDVGGLGGDDVSSTSEEAGSELPPDAPPITPVTGGTSEDGQPEPPPVHAVFSVVVRGETSWHPYAGPELNGLDEEAARAIANRLRQIDQVLREGGISASLELAYGPAAALCETDPNLLDQLESRGHRIGMHALSAGEAFRTDKALEACGRVATTVSGLASMADPHGPQEPTLETLVEALGVLSVLDLHQVVGRISPLCTNLGLAEPTHGYGTGAFTAPWRSGWTVDAPCSDLRRGRIVMIDQTPLAPGDGETRIEAGAWSTLGARTEQMLGYALDLRFAEPGDLPAPGIITWGVTVRLDDLIPSDPPEAEDADENGDQTENGTQAGNGAQTDNGGVEDRGDADDNGADSDETEPSGAIDVRTAPLSQESLTELATVIAERWGPAMESGRLVWMLPDEIGLMMRPLTY